MPSSPSALSTEPPSFWSPEPPTLTQRWLSSLSFFLNRLILALFVGDPFLTVIPPPSSPTAHVNLHVYVSASAVTPIDCNLWEVACPPADFIGIGKTITVRTIPTMTPPERLIPVEVLSLHSLEKNAVTFNVQRGFWPGDHHFAYLCVPLPWAFLPWWASVIHLLFHRWLPDTLGPNYPRQLIASSGPGPWHDCNHIIAHNLNTSMPPPSLAAPLSPLSDDRSFTLPPTPPTDIDSVGEGSTEVDLGDGGMEEDPDNWSNEAQSTISAPAFSLAMDSFLADIA
ncbi:hypothetical protein BV25DRAFT_1833636 [Artomyces pyxidatus]|uniref:Uncharacterized protein n=1 Tax=Artomyces pyxidatus TaxID=48021 RepID=A0ACB8SEY4_9AGAM|nr:hypothetical protein BV25DRAFT_1833636 [Artomyces pyxidatus]